MAEAVHIGTAAKLAGVSVDTVRFYQKVGLIKSASRSAGGYRLFDNEQIRELKFVRHGVGVLSNRSQRTARVAAKASRLFQRAIHAQAQAGGCAREDQES